MKVGMKKALSLVLALCVIFSIFACMATTVGAASYSYNPGTRGTVCTSLSSKAKSYYTGSYTYSTLSAQSASALKSSLKTLMTNTHKTKTSYENLKNYTKYSDAVAGSSSKIYDFYSSATYSGKWDNGSTWNREHVWCQSLGSFTTSNCGSDLHHLRPTDPKLNSTRNNSPFGEVSGSYKTATSNSGKVGGYYTSSYFEPLDNAKGDIARILLYCHVRWGESNITKLISSTTTLLDWMKLDPVDTWEMGRNDVVQEIQGNRNVFIDYPEYAWLMYSKSIPSHTTPSGMAKGSGSSSGGGSNSGTTTYKVTATTNNSSYGTVSVSGYKIACSPKTGYKVGSATVTSGTATTSISGNTVTVNPSTNCTVRVNFVSSGSSSSSGGNFTLVTSASQLKDGDKVIIVAANYNYAMSTTQNTSNRSQTSITKGSSTVTATSSTEVFTLGKSGSYYTFYDSSEDGYLRAASSSANQLKTGTLDDNAKWSISISSGNASIVAQGSYTRKYMRHNTSSGIFACYSSSSSQYPVAIYRQGGTSSGTTTCSHSSTSTSTTNATCTATGKTTVTCKSCGVVVSTTTIPALGHSYKYTSNSNGTHKVTCSRCTYSSSASCTYSSNTCKYCGYTQSSSGSGSTSSGSTSVSAGKYVIAAKIGSTYYAMSNSFASKISAAEIKVSGGKVSASDAEGYVVNIAKSGTSYTISNGSKYLTYSSSSNFSSSTSAYKWNISAGTNGTYRITASGSSTRGIVFYRSYTRFGAYAVSNCTADSSYYYDVELLPVSGTSSGGSSSGGSSSGSGSSSSGSTSSGNKTYELVTSASGLTAGTYVIVVTANGSYAGSYSHYALTTSKDGSYSAMSAQGLNLGSVPSSITCSASAASAYEWTLSGSRTSFKLAGGGSYLAGASGSTKLTLSSSATTWSATYSSANKGFTVKGNSRYISLRDDISTVGANGLPLFCTVSSTSTGAAYLHFYKLAG